MRTKVVKDLLKPQNLVKEVEQAETPEQAKAAQQKLQDFDTTVKAAMREEAKPDKWGFVKYQHSEVEEAAIIGFNSDRRFSITE